MSTQFFNCRTIDTKEKKIDKNIQFLTNFFDDVWLIYSEQLRIKNAPRFEYRMGKFVSIFDLKLSLLTNRFPTITLF